MRRNRHGYHKTTCDTHQERQHAKSPLSLPHPPGEKQSHHERKDAHHIKRKRSHVQHQARIRWLTPKNCCKHRDHPPSEHKRPRLLPSGPFDPGSEHERGYADSIPNQLTPESPVRPQRVSIVRLRVDPAVHETEHSQQTRRGDDCSDFDFLFHCFSFLLGWVKNFRKYLRTAGI